jgi:uncharacterized protein YeaO (DUF488 family)
MIQIKRVYDPPAKTDGKRFLVDRLWPRGIKKETLRSVDWIKEVAPGEELRRWFNHDPEKWREFQKRYSAELDAAPGTWQPLLAAAREGTVTLLYSARDTEHNNALALQSHLEKRLAKSARS